MNGKTIAEKILSAHNVSEYDVSPGNIINAKVDLIMSHFGTAKVSLDFNKIKSLNKRKVFDPNKVVVRLESDLAVAADRDAVAVVGPQDVIAQVGILRLILDSDGIAGRHEDRVVEHIDVLRHRDQDSSRVVCVDQVVGDLARVIPDVAQRTDPLAARVEHVADDVAFVVGQDCFVRVVVDAVVTGGCRVPGSAQLDAD